MFLYTYLLTYIHILGLDTIMIWDLSYIVLLQEKAKEMLFAMSGLPPGFVISRVWKSVYSDASTNANIWIEKTKKEKEGNSIMLRG